MWKLAQLAVAVTFGITGAGCDATCGGSSLSPEPVGRCSEPVETEGPCRFAELARLDETRTSFPLYEPRR
jgi:hypothetical protein